MRSFPWIDYALDVHLRSKYFYYNDIRWRACAPPPTTDWPPKCTQYDLSFWHQRRSNMPLRAFLAALAVALVLNLAGCEASFTLTSLSIIPPTQVLSTPGETSQYIAIGTYTRGSLTKTRDITNQVQWSSSDVGVATIDSAGLATVGIVPDTTTITAMATSAKGSTITGTAILTTVGGGSGQLPTLAVYSVGQGTGTVTSSPVGITCPPAGGYDCTGNFPLNTVVTLTAVANSGSQFGGWSSNCTDGSPNNPTPSCTITMSTNAAGEPANEAVGVIFNPNP